MFTPWDAPIIALLVPVPTVEEESVPAGGAKAAAFPDSDPMESPRSPVPAPAPVKSFVNNSTADAV